MDDRHARSRRPFADRRRRPSDGHRALDRARFERLVADAVSALPAEARDRLEEVDLHIEEVPREAGLLSRMDLAVRVTPDGPPIDRVTLFRRPTELRAVSKLDLIDLLTKTLTRQLLEGPGAVDGDA